MRPRAGLRGNNRNEILGSVNQQLRAKRLRDERKEQGRLRKDQQFAWETDPHAFNELKDHELAGVTELAVLKNGIVDEFNNEMVVIGDREHQLKGGKMRIISKQVVDDTLIPILQEREFKDAIMGAILSDRTGRLCRIMLDENAYKELEAGNQAFQKHFKGRTVPYEILNAEGRPEFFLGYHESSKEYALGVQKLATVVDNTNIAYDESIMNWRDSYANMRKKHAASI